MEGLLMMMASFVVGVFFVLIFLLMKFMFSPIMILIYSLFYRKKLLYKQRFALIFYKCRIINLILYTINTIVLLFMIKANPAILQNDGMKVSMMLTCAIITFYIYLYIRSKKIVYKDNLLSIKNETQNNG